MEKIEVSLTKLDSELLARAIDLAQLARTRGDHPFGAVILFPSGRSLEAMNSVVTDNDVTAHAELNAIRQAQREAPNELLAGATLYASTEPCVMCSGAAFMAKLGRVVYALSQLDLALMQPQPPCYQLDGSFPTIYQVLASTRLSVVDGPFNNAAAREVHRDFWSI